MPSASSASRSPPASFTSPRRAWRGAGWSRGGRRSGSSCSPPSFFAPLSSRSPRRCRTTPIATRGRRAARAPAPPPCRPPPPPRPRAGPRPAEYDRLPGKNVPAAYGPLTELLFRLAARLDGFAAFKLLSVLFDLGTLLVLVGLLRARREPPGRALLYGWGAPGLGGFRAGGDH